MSHFSFLSHLPFLCCYIHCHAFRISLQCHAFRLFAPLSVTCFVCLVMCFVFRPSVTSVVCLCIVMVFSCLYTVRFFVCLPVAMYFVCTHTARFFYTATLCVFVAIICHIFRVSLHCLAFRCSIHSHTFRLSPPSYTANDSLVSSSRVLFTCAVKMKTTPGDHMQARTEPEIFLNTCALRTLHGHSGIVMPI
jgi:hypothetical protein